MVIRTESGAAYQAEIRTASNGPRLFVRKDGWPEAVPAVGIFPDRLPYLMATLKVVWDGRQAIGLNARGTVTLRVQPTKVLRGMILANRRGLRSTRIVRIG